MEDLAIRDGLIITPTGSLYGGIAASKGIITYIGDNQGLPQARREIDANGKVVLPGMIDPHIHLGGAEEKRFESECRSESISAAIGGVTTMMSFVRFGDVLGPRLNTYRKAREIGSASSFIDFKVHAYMLNDRHLNEMRAIMSEGVNSFKLMMGYSAEEAKTIGLEAIGWSLAYRVFEEAAKLGPSALVQMHCEEPEIISVLIAKLKEEGREDIGGWSDSRPSICEAMHVYSAGLIAKKLGTQFYVVHASARESVDIIREFKKQGTKIFGETCPHYLLLNRNTNLGNLAKVNPPLRSSEDQERLWLGIKEGTIDTVGSDHVVQMRESKEGQSLWEAKLGFAGMGATLSLLISQGVNRGKISWEKLVKITSENTAKIFHLYPKKGALLPGADADIVIVDPEEEWKLGADCLQSASNFSVYEGIKVKGRVKKTFVRGMLIAEDARLVAEEPNGNYIFPIW